jgi:hypothetical protein
MKKQRPGMDKAHAAIRISREMELYPLDYTMIEELV